MAGQQTNGHTENRQESINSKDFLLGTLVGGIVGALSALLLAPKAGKELREEITNQTETLRHKGGEIYLLAREKSANLARNIGDQSREMADKVRDIRTRKNGEFEESRETPEHDANTAETANDESREPEFGEMSKSEVYEPENDSPNENETDHLRP